MSTTKPQHPPGHKNHPAHPAPAPAPAPAPQPPAYVPLKWSYPFATGDSKDAPDAHSFFEALSNAGDGFYPLGANGIWHGGIHFDAATGKILKQEDGVRAIADGEVVAYRLNAEYPVLKYGDGKSCMYSSGFVLVRHKLVLPPAPSASSPAGGSTPAPAKPSGDETLTFFSLYMHLLSWNTYKAAIDAPAPAADTSKTSNQPVASPVKCMPYWKGEKRYRVNASATDTQREPAPFNFPIPDPLRVNPPDGGLPPGGTPGPWGPSAAPLGWPGSLNGPQGPDLTDPFRFDRPPQSKPKQPLAKGARVYSKAKGEAIGLLPIGTEIQLGPVTDKDRGWAQITKVVKGEPVGVVVGDPVDAKVATGWVKVDQFDLIVHPQQLDSVVILDTPYPVDAGTVVGYLGEYQRYREASKLPPAPQRPILHLEVFAGPELPAFIKKSQERAKQLPDQKTFLEVSEGATLVDVSEATETVKSGLLLKPVAHDGSEGPWIKVQPTRVTMPPLPKPDHAHGHHKQPKVKPVETPEGAPVWVQRALAGKPTPADIKAWRDFPLQVSNAKAPAAGFDEVYSRGELDKFGADAKAVDDKKANWWKITVGTADGNSREAWVCGTGHPRVQWHSRWEWPGFQLIDNTSVSLIDLFKRHLYVFDMLFEGDADEFKPSALSVNGSELITKLEKVVDRLGNNDGKVSGNELARAQRVRWVAHAMSHFVVRYESEWGGDLSKWESLSSLMKDRQFIWQAELQRIAKLRWWDEVTGGVKGLPHEPAVYHFHPIGLMQTFVVGRQRHDVDLGALSTEFETGGRGSITVSGGGGDPGGVSYGAYQMTSRTRRRDGSFVIGGQVAKFVSSADFPWASEFIGLTPGSSAFSDKWRSVVTANTEKFKKIEHEYIKQTHFDPQIEKVREETRVDLRYHSHAVNDVVWSTSVQHGAATDVVVNAMKAVGHTAEENRDYDRLLIDAVYAERGKTNQSGALIRFISSSADVQAGIKKRYLKERVKAQNELEDEKNY